MTPHIRQFLLAPVLLPIALFLSGCLPIELDVSSEGRVLIARAEGYFSLVPSTGMIERLHVPENGKPVFGLFLPDGKSIIAVNETGESAMGMGRNFTIQHVTLADGTARSLYSGPNLTYVAVSPDGTTLAVTQLAKEKVDGLDENLPELLLVDIRAATNKKVVSNAAPLIRWFADSSGILAFTITRKSPEKGDYVGTLVKVATDGTASPLLAVLGSRDLFLELSADGSKALFTALGTAAPGAEVEASELPALYQLDVASGEARRISEMVSYAIYSPDGKSILLGGKEIEDRVTLSIADAANPAETTTLAEGVTKSVGGSSGATAAIYPSWLDNDTILYLASRPAFGTAGVNLHLATIDTAPEARPSDLQAAIESAVRTAK